jgi:predicted kinase
LKSHEAALLKGNAGGPMEAILFVGIQGSGKSTFFSERFFDTHVRINLDMLRTRHREKLLLQACLKARQSFVLDNTNPSRRDRERTIKPALEAGFDIVGYYFSSQLSACLPRNEKRQGRRRIPEQGIRGCAKRMEIPAFEEGFSKLYYVRLDQTFLVEERKSEF